MARVVRDDYAFFHGFGACFDNVLRDTPGCPAYGVDVHAVRTDADDAAKSRGTEMHILEEALTHLILIALQFQELGVKRVRFRDIRKPQIKTVFEIHIPYTFLSVVIPAAADRPPCQVEAADIRQPVSLFYH